MKSEGTDGDRVNARYPEFESALEQLRAFLVSHTWPREIAWVHAGALTTRGRRIVVHRGRLLTSDQVHSRYRKAVAQSHGVLLSGLTHDDLRSYCYIWAPADDLEAQYALMPDGLKLSVRAEVVPVRLVGASRFAWHRLLGPPAEVTAQLVSCN